MNKKYSLTTWLVQVILQIKELHIKAKEAIARLPEEEKLRHIQFLMSSGVPYCTCRIHDNKPAWCRLGPFEDVIMSGCGYYFENGERKGECLRCGRCCAMPRTDGNPYGVYDPAGKPCAELEVAYRGIRGKPD